MRVDKTIFIRATPSEVFPWLAPVRQPAWDKSLVRAEAITLRHGRDPQGASSAEGAGGLHQVHRALGHRFEMQAQARVDPDREFAWQQVDGDYEQHAGAFTLEREGEGTRLHLRADVELPYVMPEVVTEAQLERTVGDAFDDALFNLKELVEKARRHGG